MNKTVIKVDTSFFEFIKSKSGKKVTDENAGNVLHEIVFDMHVEYKKVIKENDSLKKMYKEAVAKTAEFVKEYKELNEKYKKLEESSKEKTTNLAKHYNEKIKKLTNENEKLLDNKRKFEEIENNNSYLKDLEDIHKKLMAEVELPEKKKVKFSIKPTSNIDITEGKKYKDNKTAHQLIVEMINYDTTMKYTVSDISRKIPAIPVGTMHAILKDLSRNKMIHATPKENGKGYYYSSISD